jgi:hypothetical protein
LRFERLPGDPTLAGRIETLRRHTRLSTINDHQISRVSFLLIVGCGRI